MSQLEDLQPGCPDCFSSNVYRNYKLESHYVSGGPKTIGSLMEKNTNKLSNDEKNHLTKQHYSYLNNRKKEGEK